MPDGEVHAPHYPTVGFVLDAVAGWINKYRQASSLNDEFRHCSPEDVMQIAKDLGVPASELRKLTAKGPAAADLMKKNANRLARRSTRLGQHQSGCYARSAAAVRFLQPKRSLRT